MNTNPLISIITINYNNKSGLLKTLESIRSQTFNDYESIIVDGGSSDGSLEILNTFLSDNNFHSHITWWCSEKDGGIYPAMNKGLSHVNGKFILMLNAGDWFCNSSVLEKVSSYLAIDNDTIVYGAVDYYNESGFYNTYSVSHTNLTKQSICHQACLIGKKAHNKIGEYNDSYKLLADWDFLLRAYTNGIQFQHIPEVIANCEMGGVSQTNREIIDRELKLIKKKFVGKGNEGSIFLNSSISFIKLILPGFLYQMIRFLCRIIKHK